MKTDWALIRRLLFIIDNSNSDIRTHEIEVEGYTPFETGWHLERLYYEGMIDATDARSMNNPHGLIIHGLTFKGDNIYQPISNKKIWSMMCHMSQKAGVDITFHVIDAVIKKATTKLFEKI